MSLAPGARLGPYEILGLIGAGGMGEVYRARDTRLNRDVALKIIPESFASDPDRLARFKREAQVLASLNHPHIAAIYGLEESGGERAIVMEFVEGEDLSQRLARGVIPVDDALPIARQIAEALEAAHEQGIAHRDLKPANIKMRSDGTVKVLDFGLAKALDPTAAMSANPMNSPTLTAATMQGVILGTAAYMAPEQARARNVDKRADIWSFGVVLYEMVTGRRAFDAEMISDVLAKVIEREPDWAVLPDSTPRRLRDLLRRCLKKDPRERLQAIGEARVRIEELLNGVAEEPREVVVTAVPLWRRSIPWAISGASAGGLALALMLWAPWRTTPVAGPLQLSVELGADVTLGNVGGGPPFDLSPDGAVLVFSARNMSGGSRQLYIRRLGQLQAMPLAGTDGAVGPFFSPDGQWIAFFSDGPLNSGPGSLNAGGVLKKIAVTGGPAVTVCDVPNSRGGAWGEDGTIVYAPTPTSGLLRVSAAGGTPEPLTSLVEGEVTHRWPQLLPGGKAVLYTTSSSVGDFQDASLVVQALPSGTRKVVAVQRGSYAGRYLRSGHLVFIREGTLFAVAFDLDKLELAGEPVPAGPGVRSALGSGGAQFVVSPSGTLAFQPGETNRDERSIHWMFRDGKPIPLMATPKAWFEPQFSPDGHKLGLRIVGASGSDIWVYEWERDKFTQLTFDPASDSNAAWTHDGSRIAFSSTRPDKSMQNLWWQRTDGAGVAQRLTDSKNAQIPGSWDLSGKNLAFQENNPQTNLDLMILPMGGDEVSGWKPGKPTVFLNSSAVERGPMFSPDGRWIAYVSDESGRDEVYVRPFPARLGSPQKISTEGGADPKWSRTRHELFFGSPKRQIWVTSYTLEGDSFRAETPRLWSNSSYAGSFALHPDGERFAVQGSNETQVAVKQDHLTFIFNFFEELRRIWATKNRD